MKILSIQYGNPENPYSHGGLARTLHENLKRLVPRHQVTCFTGLLPGPDRSIEIEGVRYIRKGKGRSKYINRPTFSLINSYIKPSDQYDLILIPWDRYAPVRLGSYNGCPVVIELNLEFFSVPSKLNIAEPFTRHLLKKQLEKCRYLITMSEGVRKSAFRYVENLRLSEILPGGIPADYLEYPVDPGEENHLLYIGRLDISHKGIDILLEAYKMAEVDVPLVIAGDGIDKNIVEKMIVQYGLTEKVRTVGWVRGKEKHKLIARSLAVCIPSRVEGWGIVATEAAAMGKPVIGTKVVGLEESVSDGETGVLVPNEDIRAFASAIRMIVEDKNFRRILGSHAREMAQEYTWDRIARKREDFFYRVIEDFKVSVDKR